MLQIEGVDPLLERAHESMLTIATAVSASAEASRSPSPATTRRCWSPACIAERGAASSRRRQRRIGAGGAPPRQLRRVLDLRAGVLRQRLGPPEARVNALLFSSLARPGTTVLRLLDHGNGIPPTDDLGAPGGAVAESGTVPLGA
jgi:hypothetical protein